MPKCVLDFVLGFLNHLLISFSELLFCLFFFCLFFLHLFILQAIYIVIQDLKMKMLFVELNIKLQE